MTAGPRQILDASFEKVRDIAYRLLADNERLQKANADLVKERGLVEQAPDAFQDQCKQQSEELQELRYGGTFKSAKSVAR